MEELTVKELLVVAKEKGIEVPLYKNGKPKISKPELIALIGEGKKAVTFSRPIKMSKSARFRKRRF